MEKKRLFEIGVLIVFFLLLVNNSMRIVNLYREEVNAPYAWAAGDGFFHTYMSQRVHEVGWYDKTLSGLDKYYQPLGWDLIPGHPPLLYYLVAHGTSLTGLEIYDVELYVVSLFVAGSAVAMYFIIKQYNELLAYLALPMMVLMGDRPFEAAVSWGQHPFIVGQFFMLLSVYLLLRRKYFLLGVSLCLTILGHTTEYIYLLPLMLFFIILDAVDKHYDDVKKLVAANAGALLVASPYLVNFYNLFVVGSGSAGNATPFALNHLETVENFGAVCVKFYHLGLFEYLVYAGIIISVFLIFSRGDRLRHYSIYFLFLLICLSNWVNQWRAFQVRFFMPILLSFFSALALYNLFVLAKKHFKDDKAAIIRREDIPFLG